MKKTVLTYFTILCLLSTVFLLGLGLNIQAVKAGGTIYIRADGSVDPLTASISTVDNITYTFTDNIYESIVVERNNTVIDGAGYTLQGTGSGYGVTLSGIENVKMQSVNIEGFENGFYLHNSSNNIVSGNYMKNMAGRMRSIYLWYSSNNTISQNYLNGSKIYLNQSSSNTISLNTLTNSSRIELTNSKSNSITRNTIADSLTYAIRPMDDCSGTVISKNNITKCKWGIYAFTSTYPIRGNVTILENNISNCTGDGISMHMFDNNNIIGNHITECMGEGLSIHVCENNNISGNVITNNQAGIALSLSSSHNSISGNNITNNVEGVYLVDSSYNTISANHITNNRIGISHYGCSNNIISRNNITENERNGITHGWSSNSIISGNHITNNNFTGIWLNSGSDNNYIFGNNITEHSEDGIWLSESSNNTISGNKITHNGAGIDLYEYSEDNSIYGNHISNNDLGIWFSQSSSNTLSHNNFVNNSQHVDIDTRSHFTSWDKGYPSGGNYWSNYTGIDSDHDGIGDTAHIINAIYTDNYPLVGMFSDCNVTWDELHVTTICNSTISNFQWDYEESTISFNVEGEDETVGFCRITIPRSLMEGPYVVKVGGQLINFAELSISNSTHAFLYFTYVHSTHEVTVVPKQLYLYHDLLDKYDSLNTTYNSLLTSYNNLQADYNELQLEQEPIINELNNVRNLMYIFIATTVILIATTVYFALRKTKIEP